MVRTVTYNWRCLVWPFSILLYPVYPRRASGIYCIYKCTARGCMARTFLAIYILEQREFSDAQRGFIPLRLLNGLALSLCPSIRSVFACIDTASAHRSLSLCLLAYILNCSKSKSSITRLDYIAIVCSRAEPASLRLIVPHLFPSHFFCFFFFFFSSSLVSWRDRSSGRLEIRQRHAIILWTVVVKGLLDQSILCCDDQSLLSFYFYF